MHTRRDDCVPLALPARAPIVRSLLQWHTQRQPFIDPWTPDPAGVAIETVGVDRARCR